MNSLTELVENSRFKIFTSIIDKATLNLDLFPQNPYVLALRECLESCFSFLNKLNQENSITYFVFEKRGKKEDNELELEFLRIVSGDNYFRTPFRGFRLVFSDKKSNSTGLQIADLTARPIGINYLKPNQMNRAYQVIKTKIIPVQQRRLNRYINNS